MKNLDKFKGCMIGGAAGDALGYSIEFLDEESIFRKYGKSGIRNFDLVEGKALVSDDTQMSLFTANGLLLGTTRGRTRGIVGTYPSYLALCYREWYRTQTERFPLNCAGGCNYTWLSHLPELFNRRAPGTTCLSAIEGGCYGTVVKPINNSKGCGGVMRVAPIGLYFIDNKQYEPEDVMRMGAETAALTHGHELGFIPAAALVHMIACLAQDGEHSILKAVEDSLARVRVLFSGASHLREFEAIMDRAVNLAFSDIEDLDAIHALGEGWVAEETLAIAVYCALKYPTDFEKGLVAAVNHRGDSDSTGAVAGNIIGANVGLDGIPQKFTEQLELVDVLLEIAQDLYNDCPMESEYDTKHWSTVWEHKYIVNDYPVWKTRNQKI
ncbi:MAG: ADP-ribosylglycohydrolase family protein [Bacteroides sp.]|nr:ADP-ribosylglycohydrolase family protein [Bacteroides sp.]MCM1548652.1 ADP-ribosylglycohydrolase family protein [Clostridium sp.]